MVFEGQGSGSGFAGWLWVALAQCLSCSHREVVSWGAAVGRGCTSTSKLTRDCWQAGRRLGFFAARASPWGCSHTQLQVTGEVWVGIPRW